MRSRNSTVRVLRRTVQHPYFLLSHLNTCARAPVGFRGLSASLPLLSGLASGYGVHTALRCPCHSFSDTSDSAPGTPPTLPTSDDCAEGIKEGNRPEEEEREDTAGTRPWSRPEWVSTRKGNGEQRMSISIRSRSQRQRSRRPQNVPPQAPPLGTDSSMSMRTHSPSRGGGGSNAGGRTSEEEQMQDNTFSPPVNFAMKAEKDDFSAFEPANGNPDSQQRQRRDADRSPSNMYKDSRLPSSSNRAPPDSPATESSSETSPNPSMTTTSNAAANKGSSDVQHSARPSGTASSTTNVQYSNTAAAAASSTHPLLYSVSRFTEPVKRIILIRNGQSEANADLAAYVRTPDWRIPLIEAGKEEAIAAGRALSELTGDEPVYFYYSPYIRSRQSLRYVLQGYDEARLSRRTRVREWWEEEEGLGSGMNYGNSIDGGDDLRGSSREGLGVVVVDPRASIVGSSSTSAQTSSSADGGAAAKDASLSSSSTLQKDASLVLDSGTSDNIIGVREDVRLRDGDIGRYTTVDELLHHLTEREHYGNFFYRFPHGESGADVCDRMTSFLDAFQRERVEFPMDTNVVLITHGLTIRMFIKRWFHLTVDTFHNMKSPPPGSLCTLTRLHHRSCFRLDESCVDSMHLPVSLNEFNGYKYRNKQLLGSMSSGAPYM